MPHHLSQDINSLFASFDVENPKYNELVEKERYQRAIKKWPALCYSRSSEVSSTLADLNEKMNDSLSQSE